MQRDKEKTPSTPSTERNEPASKGKDDLKTKDTVTKDEGQWPEDEGTKPGDRLNTNPRDNNSHR